MFTSYKSVIMVIKKEPFYVIQMIINMISRIGITLIPIYAVKEIVSMHLDNQTAGAIVLFVIIRFAILAGLSIIVALTASWEHNQMMRFTFSFEKDFLSRMKKIDYSFFSSPEFLDKYMRVLFEGTSSIKYLVQNIFLLIIEALKIATIFVIIATLNKYIILASLGLGLFYVLVHIRIGFLNKKINDEQQKNRRYGWYANKAFSLKFSMPDIKTTSIDKLLIEKNDDAMDGTLNIYKKYLTRVTILGYFADIAMVAVYPLIIAMVGYYTVDIKSELAPFAALATAAMTLSVAMRSITGCLARIQSNLPEAKTMLEIQNMKGEIESSDIPPCNIEVESIKLNNVSFSYEKETNQLDNINIEIKKGDKIAIVGENGAGKTTLVKMILRLLDVDEGQILLNDKPYKEYNPKSIRKVIGAVYQDTATYALTFAENILLRRPINKEDYLLVDEALKFSGLYDYVYSFNEGVNKNISREFHSEGAELSKGQVQQLTIARGYAQDFQVFILDEPSSALDPLAEERLYKNLIEIGKNKTVLFISHRLTTTINADKILLFKNGKIKEQGTHDELMRLNGDYKKLFASQASKYIGEEYE